jgi:hypothetical protein
MPDKWFEVDKKGLSKLMERRGKEFVVYELIQNAWDQNVTRVDVDLSRDPGSQLVKVHVTDDDPEGFKNLEHAWTLFAESDKKGNAEKRGRFNLGEKLVLAVCDTAAIQTTKGTVVFDRHGRKVIGAARERGSQFRGLMKMTQDEMADVVRAIRRIIPPHAVPTRLNGELITPPCFLKEIVVELPTEIGDEEGMLRRSRRKTTVTIYDTRMGETAYLYEMGIPVCETGDKYHIDVGQKVPLNMDRDNVSAAYLTELRTAVLNAMLEHLKPLDLENDKWLRDAAGSKDAAPEAIAKVMDLRFGDKRVIYDPTDPEANKLAVAKGYTVIHGGMMSGAEWTNVKENNLAQRAGLVTPSPKPYAEHGDPANVIPREKWTPAMEWTERFSRKMAVDLLGCDISVTFVHTTNNFGACYGSRCLDFNVFRLGKAFFENAQNTDAGLQRLMSLLIHEFGHHFSMDHLSSEFHDALCDLGAKLWMITKS